MFIEYSAVIITTLHFHNFSHPQNLNSPPPSLTPPQPKLSSPTANNSHPQNLNSPPHLPQPHNPNSPPHPQQLTPHNSNHPPHLPQPRNQNSPLPPPTTHTPRSPNAAGRELGSTPAPDPAPTVRQTVPPLSARQV